VVIHISEKRVASIFNVECSRLLRNFGNYKTTRSHIIEEHTLKFAGRENRQVNRHQTTRRHIPEDSNLHSHRREDLRTVIYTLWVRNTEGFEIQKIKPLL
jgi:hypothetical protein